LTLFTHLELFQLHYLILCIAAIAYILKSPGASYPCKTTFYGSENLCCQ